MLYPQPLTEPFKFLLALLGLSVLAHTHPCCDQEALGIVDFDLGAHLLRRASRILWLLALSDQVYTRTRARQLGVGVRRVDNLTSSRVDLPGIAINHTVEVNH